MHKVVSKSSAEAEFRSLVAMLAELAWIQCLLAKLRIQCPIQPTVFYDNLSAVLLAANPILHSRTEHFERDLYFVYDQINQRKVFVVHIPSSKQVADILTKPPPSTDFDPNSNFFIFL